MTFEKENIETKRSTIITINVPVVYMARCVMVLRRARSITRGIERGWPWKSRLFLAPGMVFYEGRKKI
jgi:hypothetical protein